MSVTKVVPTSKEREFRIEELFFSTTDRKGIIKTGNSVFRRVAGYEEGEMMGRPHNIIRHPDMPRCVFRLLWDYLEAGRPIAAYVKNMAKDGGYYWVLATVSPIDGGYLSVRLKPSTPYHRAVEGLYTELLAIEQAAEAAGKDRKAAMDESTARLLAALRTLGFQDYDAFIRVMLPAEMTSRDQQLRAQGKLFDEGSVRVRNEVEYERLRRIVESAGALGRYLEGIFLNLDNYASLNRQLADISNFLFDLAADVRLFSFNAVVSAGHLAAAGAALGEVASLMCHHSETTSRAIGELATEIGDAAKVLSDVSFGTSIARLQIEMTLRFAHELLSEEAGKPGRSAAHVLQNNVRSLAACLDEDIERLVALPRSLKRVSIKVQSVQSSLRVLSALQFNGRVECARVTEAEGFGVLFDEIGARLSAATAEIAGLESSTDETGLKRVDTERVRGYLGAIQSNAMRQAA